MGVMPIDDPTKLRSYSWFNGKEYYNFSRRANVRALGISREAFHGKPVIGICNSFSELNNCNAHLRQVAEAVKRGVWAAGGFPLEFPVISLGEQYMKPTTMLFRNLMAMDVEESIRANPLDGVVLLCGCDKTTPAMLMGAASADIPAMILTGGPTLSGNYQGKIDRAGHRRAQDFRPLPHGQGLAGGVAGDRGLHGAQRRALHGDGHGIDDGDRGRGAGHVDAGLGGGAGAGFAPHGDGGNERAADGGDGARRICGRRRF